MEAEISKKGNIVCVIEYGDKVKYEQLVINHLKDLQMASRISGADETLLRRLTACCSLYGGHFGAKGINVSVGRLPNKSKQKFEYCI